MDFLIGERRQIFISFSTKYTHLEKWQLVAKGYRVPRAVQPILFVVAMQKAYKSLRQLVG